jgi:hypothetical protein
MTEQWQNFLKNLGEWRGSFTRMSPNGDLLDSTPSLLTLTQKSDLVEFRLRRYSSGSYDDPPSQDYSQAYTSLGRQACFFETGAFSKGSLQFNPYGEFGAEYGFIDGDRRSRLVQLFATQGECTSLTLIREFRSHTDAQERLPLQVEQLQGWRPPTTPIGVTRIPAKPGLKSRSRVTSCTSNSALPGRPFTLAPRFREPSSGLSRANGRCCCYPMGSQVTCPTNWCWASPFLSKRVGW